MNNKITYLTILFALFGLRNTVNAQENVSFKDSRDGKTYKTIKIGKQIWMAENLNFKSPNGSWCYDDNTSNGNTYGRLYDWQTAKTACPSGWHLPSDAEWTQLTDNLGGESVAGYKMKESGTTHWNSSNTATDNSSGFTAVPGGYRNYNSTFNYIVSNGYWWSSTEYDTDSAGGCYLYSSGSDVFRDSYSKSNGFSIRCLKD